MESIHQRIKRLREAKGLSQEALAKLAGVTYQSVQEWERADGTAPTRKRQAKVAAALGITVQELVVGPSAATAAEPAAEYGEFSQDERSLIARYRAADPRWQLSLRLLAALATEQQIEVATDVNVIIARIIGKKPSEVRYAENERVAAAYGQAPHVRPHTPLVDSRTKRQGVENSDRSAKRNGGTKAQRTGKT
jgi:transcriptional regulator with XRE-family HTH domain